MDLDAWHKPTDFDIMITIANTRGFGAFLSKYMYNKYIFTYITNIIYQDWYVYLLKMQTIPEN